MSDDTQAALAAALAQVAALSALLRRRAGLLGELDTGGGVDYASPADLTVLDDLPEFDLIVKRWRVSGKSLKLRVRALDLDQQEKIDIESTIKHPQTGEWVRSDPLYVAATLREGVIVPTLDNAKAQMLRKHNPVIINEIVSFIWRLSSLDDDFLERLIHLDDPPAPATTELSAPGE